MMNRTTPTGEAGAIKTATSPSEAASCAQPAPVDPDPSRTIRVISTYVRTPAEWRRDVTVYTRNYRPLTDRRVVGSEAERIRQAAATAELWDLPVGIISSVREERG